MEAESKTPAEAHAGSAGQKTHGVSRHSYNRYMPYVYVSILYLILALVMFAPISAHMSSVANGIGGDVYQNLWNIWWIKYSLSHLHGIFYTTLLYWPVGANLVYQTMAPIASLISIPFQAVSTTFAFNVLFFLGYMLSGLTMFILADYVVKNKYAAFVAGLIFTFSATHVAHSYGSIVMSNIEWIPLALYFFLKLLDSDKSRAMLYSAVGLGLSMMLVSFMSTIEMTVVTFDLLALVFLVYLISPSTRKRVLNLRFWEGVAVAIVLMLITGIWGFVPAIHTLLSSGASSTANYLNGIQNNEVWSVDLLSFFLPNPYNGVFSTMTASYFGIFSPDIAERSAYIGYTVLALAAYAVFKERRKTILWVSIAVIFAWLSLGPYLQVGGVITGLPELFLAYHSIPLLNIVREPGRFDIIAMIAMAMLAAIGTGEVLKRFGSKGGDRTNAMFVLGIIIILLLVETNGFQIGSALVNSTTTHVAVPNLFYEIKNLSGNFSILMLPALPIQNSYTPALYPGMESYYASITGKPLVGGYVTRANTTMDLSVYNIPLAVQSTRVAEAGNITYPSPVMQSPVNQTLLTLFNYDTGFVVLMRQAYNSSRLNLMAAYLGQIFGNPVYVDNSTIAYQTSNAIKNNVFKSYVAFPSLTSWSPQYVPLNGTDRLFWVPITGSAEQGTIAVYAPYQTNSSLQMALSGASGSVNTTISFIAFSNSGSAKAYVAGESASGFTPTSILNVTSTPRLYTVDTQLTSGERGDTLLFGIEQNYTTSGSVVYFGNITFSKS